MKMYFDYLTFSNGMDGKQRGRSVCIILAVLLFTGMSLELAQAQLSSSKFELRNQESHGELIRKTAPYTYSSEGRRDPFVPILKKVATQQHTVKSNKSFVKSDNSRTLQILGILSGRKGMYALIQNAMGRRYVVSAGDILKSEKVRIKQLTTTMVVLEPIEEYRSSGSELVINMSRYEE